MRDRYLDVKYRSIRCLRWSGDALRFLRHHPPTDDRPRARQVQKLSSLRQIGQDRPQVDLAVAQPLLGTVRHVNPLNRDVPPAARLRKDFDGDAARSAIDEILVGRRVLIADQKRPRYARQVPRPGEPPCAGACQADKNSDQDLQPPIDAKTLYPIC